MLKFVAIATVAALSAMGAAQAVATLDALKGAEHKAMAAVVEQPVQGQPTAIAKAKDGHFWAEADVNGSAVHFLVDTGATTVALSSADALRLGFHPAELDYKYKVTTASGEALAAKVKLRSVAVAGARVNEVDALIIDEGLEVSLLGMSYLGRLSRMEVTPTSLILRP